ncbi:hypothetical protein AVEN_180709-1 [Araneus ventricosus]|uniref:Uncharacterized protein n=1 Tax=Araneus ventricosus TaxID=182803 RepID=A0A4Y2FZJ9_ARAVE|nr:hypothetical protein AVEN_180709-1 [Araneus ventricosus]
MKVDILKFSSLFSKLDLEKEFYRVTEKLNPFQYVPKFLESYCEKLNTLLIAEKKFPAWAQTIKCMLDGSDRNVQVVKAMFVLVTLSVHFSEHQLAFSYPPTVTENCTEEGSASTYLGIVGLETKTSKFCVSAEHQIVLQLSTFPEALAVLVASNLHFPL